MNKYVCDKDLAQELDKRGIVKDAENWWVYVPDMVNVDMNQFESLKELYTYIEEHDAKHWVLNSCNMSERKKKLFKAIPAPIAEELLELVPDRIITHLDGVSGMFYLNLKKYSVCYKAEMYTTVYSQSANTLSNALAKMLIWLDDNGYLKKG